MLTLLDLTNRALSELGRLSVNAIDNSPDAETVSEKILELAPEVLLEYNWNWAVQYVADYSPVTNNPTPDFVYAYALPGNYGKFFRFASTGADWPIYAIQDQQLLVNTLPVQYYYIVNSTSFDIWPPLVARTLVLYAAAKCALTLTNNIQLTGYLENEYVKMRTRAIQQDDMERGIVSTPYNDFQRITFV